MSCRNDAQISGRNALAPWGLMVMVAGMGASLAGCHVLFPFAPEQDTGPGIPPGSETIVPPGTEGPPPGFDGPLPPGVDGRPPLPDAPPSDSAVTVGDGPASLEAPPVVDAAVVVWDITFTPDATLPPVPTGCEDFAADWDPSADGSGCLGECVSGPITFRIQCSTKDDECRCYSAADGGMTPYTICNVSVSAHDPTVCADAFNTCCFAP